jgi:histone acetyltransferase (RNA polymerase elongator complex component)
MIQNYRQRWPDAELEVAFFHGSIPDDAMLAAVENLPIRLSVHPSDLRPQDAVKLRQAGTEIIELEIMTFDPHVLRTCRRNYTSGRAIEMVRALKSMGFAVGAHLVPGLPGSGNQENHRDLEQAYDSGVDFLRIWPALALETSVLADWAERGEWSPWDVSEAVEAIVRLVDSADDLGLPVIRIGIQPGHDIPVKAIAGPVHPNIRGQVESLRFSRKLEDALPARPEGRDLTFVVHPKDISWVKGTSNANANRIKERNGVRSIKFQMDETVQRGTVRVHGEGQ